MSGELWQVICGVGGAVVGWLARGSNAGIKLPGIPGEVVLLLRRLVERRQTRQTRGLLEELLVELKQHQEEPAEKK